jgi:hypothetical protein
MTRIARLVVATVATVAFAVLGIAGPFATTRTVGATDGTTTAVIVIDTGASVRAVTLPVGGGMSGLAALQLVATVTTYGFGGIGGAVCAIDGVGNEATQSSCLVGPNGAYWAYFHSAGGASSWSYSPVGAGSYILHGGDVDGWRYGTGQRPAASPVFCDYVSCPAPPPATAPPSGGSANVGGSGASSGGAVASSGSGAAGGTAGSAAPGTTDVPGAAAGASATNPGEPSTTASGTATTSPRRGSVSVEAAGAPHGGGADSGSPVGVLVAVGLLALGGGAAVLLRRRARAPG